MDVEQVLCMNGGEGETSYSTSSMLQRKLISMAKPLIEKAVSDVCAETCPKYFAIADLGCSSGPNTLLVISDIIGAVKAFCSERDLSPPEFHAFLNDLPGNDFNTIFKTIPSFQDKLKEKDSGIKEEVGACFIAGAPGSFYGRLFPSNTICFVHSSLSAHFLSQIPQGIEDNKRNVYATKTSPERVIEAFLQQYQKDFSLFLNSRAEEMIPGGRMVITFMGRSLNSSEESCYYYHFIAKSLNDLVSEGHIEEAKLNSFNFPIYLPCIEELRDFVKIEGSFDIDFFETLEFMWGGNFSTQSSKNYVFDKVKSGQDMAKMIRAVTEPMLRYHFGEEIMDALFLKYAEHVAEHPGIEMTKQVILVVCFSRKK